MYIYTYIYICISRAQQIVCGQISLCLCTFVHSLLWHVQFFNNKTKLSGVKSCPKLALLLHNRLDESFDASSIGGTCGTCADVGCGKQLELVEVV